jgi:heterodisulfide reductase subunit B
LDFSYFPGCVAHSSGIDQHLSTLAIFKVLDISLVELEDWNCCGATPGHTIGGELSVELCSRNLKIATDMGNPLVVPCASCFNNLRKAATLIKDRKVDVDPQLQENVVDVISIAALLSMPSVIEKIKKNRKVSLEGLTIAPYYGCLLTRPISTTQAVEPENPCEIDEIASICGARAALWPYKTDCCGGPHTLSHPELVTKMSTPLLAMAKRWGADVIVTACPMCHASLDSTVWNSLRNNEDKPIVPVLYVTELVSLALDIEKPARWFKRHLVDPRPLLRAKGVLK